MRTARGGGSGRIVAAGATRSPRPRTARGSTSTAAAAGPTEIRPARLTRPPKPASTESSHADDRLANTATRTQNDPTNSLRSSGCPCEHVFAASSRHCRPLGIVHNDAMLRMPPARIAFLLAKLRAGSPGAAPSCFGVATGTAPDDCGRSPSWRCAHRRWWSRAAPTSPKQRARREGPGRKGVAWRQSCGRAHGRGSAGPSLSPVAGPDRGQGHPRGDRQRGRRAGRSWRQRPAARARRQSARRERHGRPPGDGHRRAVRDRTGRPPRRHRTIVAVDRTRADDRRPSAHVPARGSPPCSQLLPLGQKGRRMPKRTALITGAT